MDISVYSTYTWTSIPAPGTSPANAQLLKAAKSLLQGIYGYTAGSPDYLPGSYTLPASPNTDYWIHAKEETRVLWPAVNGQQVIWRSVPGTSPQYWSGTVQEARLADMRANTNAVADCHTDCSGFITSLFTYVNSQGVATVFSDWRAGQDNAIPEAGCFDPPGTGDGLCHSPNAKNYFTYFTQGLNGFQPVTLAEIQPGDLLAFANTKNQSDSGHVMLVVAVGQDPSDRSGNTQFVVVADETMDEHDDDSRGTTQHGVGLGIAKLVQTSGGLEFYWKGTSAAAQQCAPALGRAVTN